MAKREIIMLVRHGHMTVKQASERVREQLLEAGKEQEREEEKQQQAKQ